MALPRLPLIASSSSTSGLLSRSASVKPLFFRSCGEPLPISFAGSMRRPPAHRILASLSRSAASSGGGGGDELGAGGGGGGGGDGGDTESRSLVGELDDASVLESEVIVLTVGGMSCGGCAASVKRILESQARDNKHSKASCDSLNDQTARQKLHQMDPRYVKKGLRAQPQVAAATVNLETETAVIWVSPDFEVAEDWQKQLGEKLANHLTTCGFQSSLKGVGEEFKEEIPP